jgi:hypothetical protein
MARLDGSYDVLVVGLGSWHGLEHEVLEAAEIVARFPTMRPAEHGPLRSARVG